MEINSSRGQSKNIPVRPLSESQQINAALLKMSVRLGRPIDPQRAALWHEDLCREPIGAIIYAFDSWGENESRLPTLSDIRRLCRDWRAGHQPSGPSECDAECKAAHGSGYDRNDVLWLMKQFLGKRLSHKDWKNLVNELNANREGGVPSAFRKTAMGDR